MDLSYEIREDASFYPAAGSTLSFAIGFFFSIRTVIPLFCVRLLGIDPQIGAEAKLAFDFMALGLVGFALLGTANRTLRSIVQLPTIRWIMCYLGFCGCSLLWSETASAPASIVYWCGTVSDVAIVMLLLTNDSVTRVVNSLLTGFVWSACCIALIAWIMPAQYDLRLGDGDFFNSNTIADICAFALFYAQYLMRRCDSKWTLGLCFLGITLIRSLSKTTIVAFLVSEGYLLIQDRSISRRAKLFLTFALLLTVLVFWGLFEAYYDFYTTYGNQAETLTGRTAIWAYVLDAALQHPWIGHGFDSMWKVVPTFGTFEARHAENEFLEQFYCYGVVGVVMLCGIYGNLYLKIRRLQEGPLRVIFVSILIYVIVRGFAEAEPFDLLLPLWAIVMIAMLVNCADAEEHGVTSVSSLPPSEGESTLKLSSNCNF